ncbi:MAG: AraC family transcriptional regulator ligand-binding domain-containing protein [Sandaracinaceae bacterium]
MVPRIHAFWLQAALAHGKAKGIALARMLDVIALDPDAVGSPLLLVPLEAHYTLLEWLESELGTPEVALAIGGSLSGEEIGAPAFLTGTAATLRQGLDKFMAFLPKDGERYELQVDGGTACIRLHHAGPSRRAHALRAASFVTDLAVHAPLFVEGGFKNLTARLATRDEVLLSALRKRVAIEVRGGQPHDALRFDAADLDRAPPDANRALHAFFDEYLEPHRERPHPTATARLGRLIDARLLEGQVDSASLARACGWSPRTLQRRLSKDGTTLRVLVRERRLARAREVLDAGGSMSEAAFESGYSEASALHRALRKTKSG